MKNLFDAFISYGRADSKAFATKLYQHLTEQGLKIWFDQNDIPLGVDFQNQIYDGIEKAHNFIFIIAPHSVKSPYCLKEILHAVKHNKRIIPLLHVMPQAQEVWDKMHPTIGKINWIYFQEDKDDFEGSFRGLIQLIRHQADYVEQHTQFLVKALEWERNQKQNSHLLIRSERLRSESWLKIRFKDEQPPCIPTDLHCEFICESTKNANNLMTQVFISYAEKDKAIMEKIGKTLMREGLTIWTNKTDIKTGMDFQNVIYQGIEQADNVVYLLSPAAIESKYCQDEVARAFANNKRILTLLIEATDIEQIPPQISRLQFLDFTGHQDEEEYRRVMAQVLNELSQEARYYEQHKILLVQALKWQEQNRNPSILLRGYNLQYYETWLKVAKQRLEHQPLPLHEEFIAESLRQPTDSSLEVFISYSRADSDFARKLNEAIQLHGKTTWLDQECIASGTDFQQEIFRGIENSDNFLFIISPNSVHSPYCAGEVEYARQLHKKLVTVLYAEVSSQDLHPGLASIQWIDFNQHNGDFYANFSELIRTLDTDREHVRHHTKWSQRSLEWQQKDKSADLLLRGSEFAIAQNWLQEAEQQNKQPKATDLQKEYITASHQAILAAIQQEKRQKIVLKSLLGLVSGALVAAVGIGVVAFVQWKRAETVSEGQINSLTEYSEALRNLNQEFDALMQALIAGRQLQKQRVQPETRRRVVAALRVALYGVQEQNRLEGHNDQVTSISFSPDGKMIATASVDNTVKLWNQDGQILKTLTGHSDRINSVSFSPDGKTIATASWDQTVKLWNQDGELLKTLTGHSDRVNSVRFSPDGKRIVTASWDKTVKLWSIDGQILETFTGHYNWVLDAVFSPDGQTIASASADYTVKLWHHDGKLLKTLTGHKAQVNSVSFSPDGQRIATASADKTVKLWSKDGQLLNTLTEHTDWVNSVSFSPDSQRIATASADKTVKFWSQDGQLLQTLPHRDSVKSISFSPNGQIVATASADGTARLWIRDNREFQTLSGHKNRILYAVFSPDGKTIATASADGTAKLWSQNGQLLQTLTGHKAQVNSVSFSPDGKTIATASADKTAKL